MRVNTIQLQSELTPVRLGKGDNYLTALAEQILQTILRIILKKNSS